MVGSSAVVGSSASSSAGWQAMASAIITRWRMPPDSWCGYGVEAALGLRDADRAEQLDGAVAGGPALHAHVDAQQLGHVLRRWSSAG